MNYFSGYNPIFDESFEFQINLPELALVRFAVLDDDYIGDEFIGQYTIPFECMQTGEERCDGHAGLRRLMLNINKKCVANLERFMNTGAKRKHEVIMLTRDYPIFPNNKGK